MPFSPVAAIDGVEEEETGESVMNVVRSMLSMRNGPGDMAGNMVSKMSKLLSSMVP